MFLHRDCVVGLDFSFCIGGWGSRIFKDRIYDEEFLSLLVNASGGD